MKTRRRFTAEQKVRILREHLDNQVKISEIKFFCPLSGCTKPMFLLAKCSEPSVCRGQAIRLGLPNQHNGRIPHDFWLEPWGVQAIIDFKRAYPEVGYRLLTYMMMDAKVVAVSPGNHVSYSEIAQPDKSLAYKDFRWQKERI